LKEVWSSEGWGRSFEDSFEWKVGEGRIFTSGRIVG